MKFKRRIKDEVDINLAPLIDVIFILLLFFVVSSTFTRHTQIQLKLPVAENGIAAEQQQSIEVDIDNNGQYAINGQVITRQDAHGLTQALAKIADGNFDQPINIRGDGSSDLQKTITVMDMASKLGFNKINFNVVHKNDTD